MTSTTWYNEPDHPHLTNHTENCLIPSKTHPTNWTKSWLVLSIETEQAGWIVLSQNPWMSISHPCLISNKTYPKRSNWVWVVRWIQSYKDHILSCLRYEVRSQYKTRGYVIVLIKRGIDDFLSLPFASLHRHTLASLALTLSKHWPPPILVVGHHNCLCLWQWVASNS